MYIYPKFRDIMIAEIDWVLSKAKFILEGKLLNWPWRTHTERHRIKEIAKSHRVISYLGRYAPAFTNIQLISDSPNYGKGEENEKIFTIWLQGEKNAPPIVKACFSSMRINCSQELIILDESSLFDWIELPDYVIDKWRSGKMKPAHFTDICRLELLYRHGGFWMDATDFIVSPLPQWLIDTDFFVYHSGNNDKLVGFYSFVQNCFIRARKNNSLVKAWRDAVLIYWKNEVRVKNYFVHQLIFKKMIDCNSATKELYNKMPYLVQDPTHTVWFEHASAPFDMLLFDELTANIPFQKTEYQSFLANNPIPGSFAEVMINMYND